MKPIIVTLIILQCLYITGLGVYVRGLQVKRLRNQIKLDMMKR